MLDAKIASALNMIIQPIQEGRSVSTNRKPRKRTGFYENFDYFRVTGTHGTVLNNADLFYVTLHDDNIQEFDTRWDEVLLSMSKIPSNDVLESLYKLRIRESDQLKTVLELYDMENHQKISLPNHQKLKTVVKKRPDQKLRLRNCDARHVRIETGAVGLRGVQGGKCICYPWKDEGQCSKGKPMQFPA